MSRISNTATKEELKAIHKAKMAGKKYDAARRFYQNATHLTDLPEGLKFIDRGQ